MTSDQISRPRKSLLWIWSNAILQCRSTYSRYARAGKHEIHGWNDFQRKVSSNIMLTANLWLSLRFPSYCSFINPKFSHRRLNHPNHRRQFTLTKHLFPILLSQITILKITLGQRSRWTLCSCYILVRCSWRDWRFRVLPIRAIQNAIDGRIGERKVLQGLNIAIERRSGG